MTTLDTVIQMQQKGMTDIEISKTLQSQGVAPTEINTAINQAKIKSAVGGPVVPGQNDSTQMPGQMNGVGGQAQPSMMNTPQSQMQPQQSMMSSGQGSPAFQAGQAAAQSLEAQGGQVQPSMMNQAAANQSMPASAGQQSIMNAPQGQGSPSVMNAPAPQAQTLPPQQNPQDYYPEESLYSEGEYYGDDGGYYDDGYGGGGGYTDTETIAEISAQVVDERFREYNKKTGDMSIFKTMIEDKVKNIEARLTRIESTIDKLEHAVVQKIGEFGENTQAIKKDLENLHNTTAKLMNPLIDNARALDKLKKK